jgi:hypothetical protein
MMKIKQTLIWIAFGSFVFAQEPVINLQDSLRKKMDILLVGDSLSAVAYMVQGNEVL